MKKITKRLALTTQTIRVLQSDDLSQVQGGTNTISSGTSVIRPGTIATTVQSNTISGGTSVISAGGGGGH
jgi:hypothetical protein